MQVVRPECRKLESPFGDVAITAALRSPATKLKTAIREEIGALSVRRVNDRIVGVSGRTGSAPKMRPTTTWLAFHSAEVRALRAPARPSVSMVKPLGSISAAILKEHLWLVGVPAAHLARRRQEPTARQQQGRRRCRKVE
jgi:hypothetical protein